MKSLLLATLFCAAFFSVATAQQAPSIALDNYKWKHRVVIAFAPDAKSPALRELKQSIELNREAFRDRDLVFIEIRDHSRGLIDSVAISNESTMAIVDRFTVHQDHFVVYLIGKDGGTKLKGDDKTTLSEIFALIDTMPMRRSEMKRDHRGQP